jgi:hypothetical protein
MLNLVSMSKKRTVSILFLFNIFIYILVIKFKIRLNSHKGAEIIILFPGLFL